MSNSVYGPGKEISYTRAVVSTLPFVGIAASVVNFVQFILKQQSINNVEKQRQIKAGQQDENVKSAACKTETIRNLKVNRACAKMGVASSLFAIAILVALAASGKMPPRLVALSLIPLTAGVMSGLIWRMSNKGIISIGLDKR